MKGVGLWFLVKTLLVCRSQRTCRINTLTTLGGLFVQAHLQISNKLRASKQHLRPGFQAAL